MQQEIKKRKRIKVAVLTHLANFRLVVHVPNTKPPAYLLLAGYQPIERQFSPGQRLDVEILHLLDKKTGQCDFGFNLFPRDSDEWQIHLKSACPLTRSDLPMEPPILRQFVDWE